jgi:hypothetical protein
MNAMILLADSIFHPDSSGSAGFAHGVFIIFCAVLIGLILWGLGRWFFPKLGMPATGMMIWDGLFVLIAAIVIINFLAGLMGHQIFPW